MTSVDERPSQRTEGRLRVGFYCPECSRYNEYTVSPTVRIHTCSQCGHQSESSPSPSVLSGGPVDRCPQCGNEELYLRKDFPQQLGCAVVTVTVVLSTVAYAMWGFPASLAVLAVASGIDFVLYHRLGEIPVCYRCHCELRGFERNPEHRPFDLSRAEEYEQGS
jgi:Zn ribbon nucleic-acid-binding protein